MEIPEIGVKFEAQSFLSTTLNPSTAYSFARRAGAVQRVFMIFEVGSTQLPAELVGQGYETEIILPPRTQLTVKKNLTFGRDHILILKAE